MADEEAVETEESKGGGKPWLLILVAALISLGAGAGGTFFLIGGGGAPAEEAAEVGEEEAAPETRGSISERTHALDPFVVNVSGEGYPRYLKLSVAFEMASVEAKEELEARQAQVRDTTILLISSKRLSEISNFEGKALLKDDLRDRVNGLLGEGRVESVLFTEFVVQ